MAKPTRYSRLDRIRKGLGTPFRTRLAPLLRQRNYLSILHIQKSILAAQALRRCVDLEDQLEQALATLEQFGALSGCCMCGSPMEGHDSALTCGHSPMDSADYYIGQVVKAGRGLLAKPLEGREKARFLSTARGVPHNDPA